MPLSHVALAVLVVAVWGTNFVVVHEGLERFPPLTYSMLRFALVSLPLLVFIRPPRVPATNVILYGVMVGAGQTGLMIYAMAGHISPGLASLLIQTQAFFTIALALLFEGERLRPGNIAALALCTAGVALIAGHAGGGADVLGILLVLAAALGWAGGNILVRRTGDTDMLALMVWSGLAAVPPLLVAALLLEGPNAILASFRSADALGWATIPWQSFANALFGYSVWNWLLARHRAVDVAPMGLLVPLFGLSASAWILAEPMPGWKLTAAALVVAGLAINVWATRMANNHKQGEAVMSEAANPRIVNLGEQFDRFEERWAPKIIARYNDNEVRLVKTDGEWVWHSHPETDELFLIIDGEFDMDFRDRTVTVGPGELLLVPRGVEHRPAARRGLVKLLLIDPDGTPNTGDVHTATHAVEL